ncbi:hypothetical protein Tco_0659997 [Tanacetum coccineum]
MFLRRLGLTMEKECGGYIILDRIWIHMVGRCKDLNMDGGAANEFSIVLEVNKAVARHGVHVSIIPDKDGMYIEVLERDVEFVRNTSGYEFGESKMIRLELEQETTKIVVIKERPKEAKDPSREFKLIDRNETVGDPTGKLPLFARGAKFTVNPHLGSIVDIPYSSMQTNTAVQASVVNDKWCLLKITLQAPFFNVQMTSVHNSSGLVLHQMTSDHNRSELGIQDHSNEPSSSKLVPKVVP